jgi:hypothetical protein
VPIKVKIVLDSDGNKVCEISVAQFIYFDSRETRSIHWQLIDDGPASDGRFVFGHTDAQRDGIEFELDVDADFENESRSDDLMFKKKLRRPGVLDRAKMYYYDILVEHIPPAGARVPCEARGPAIINRGR